MLGIMGKADGGGAAGDGGWLVEGDIHDGEPATFGVNG
jgi:hypothetical protein